MDERTFLKFDHKNEPLVLLFSFNNMHAYDNNIILLQYYLLGLLGLLTIAKMSAYYTRM